jgi:hypothetical protein
LVSVHVLECAYLCFKCQEIARELVLLREQMASCQASEARMEAGFSSKAMEATIWQASSLAGVAYALVQHVARPLWVRHFETDFPLDRFVYLPGLLYLILFDFMLICWTLVCRPFNWMVELLGRLASSCRERLQRRASASTASTQQDPEVRSPLFCAPKF